MKRLKKGKENVNRLRIIVVFNQFFYLSLFSLFNRTKLILESSSATTQLGQSDIKGEISSSLTFKPFV